METLKSVAVAAALILAILAFFKEQIPALYKKVRRWKWLMTPQARMRRVVLQFADGETEIREIHVSSVKKFCEASKARHPVSAPPHYALAKITCQRKIHSGTMDSVWSVSWGDDILLYEAETSPETPAATGRLVSFGKRKLAPP